MAKKHNYYVVWNGRQKGIFNNWEDCKASVKGYSNADFEGFHSLEEAKEAYEYGKRPPEPPPMPAIW